MYCYQAGFLAILFSSIRASLSDSCHADCPLDDTSMICGFSVANKTYKMFPSNCAMEAYSKCVNLGFSETPLRFCIKEHLSSSRRMYEESCPVFCAQYYRPVCAASRIRDYSYRSFQNGCWLDMINCRGSEDSGYVEVPLRYCPNHAMKNIFSEQVIISNIASAHDF